ncbi:MAG: TonB-dependent receptor plug domain-containing protein, partial [Chitinophagaceae bacterium]|nr:TonB-dependent receptor plug domain-containing protein [Chitinophagaceae bacterium]
MKIFFLLSSTLLLLPAITFCQSDSIQFYNGYVLNNSKALPSVSVVAATSKKGVLTNRQGFFKIPKAAGAKMIVHFSAVGYQHLAKEIEVTQTQTDTIELQPLIAQMEDVVVSGTMKAISKMDSPIPVEVYTPALFKKNPSPNIFESLQMVNGVQPQLNCNVCNTGDIHINGMEGPYTMILIDGMPIVSSLSTVYGLAGIPNSLIKRVEIVKGPASTLYGSEAVGGLINIITKDPLNAEKFKVDLSSTSIGEYNTDITTGFKLKNASSVIGINYFNYWNKRDINNDNFTDVTLQNRFSIFNKWNFKTNSNRIAT